MKKNYKVKKLLCVSVGFEPVFSYYRSGILNLRLSEAVRGLTSEALPRSVFPPFSSLEQVEEKGEKL